MQAIWDRYESGLYEPESGNFGNMHPRNQGKANQQVAPPQAYISGVELFQDNLDLVVG